MKGDLYKAGPLDRWKGVCEIHDDFDQTYFYHYAWPARNEGRIYTLSTSLVRLTTQGLWEPLVPEDQQVAPGL